MLLLIPGPVTTDASVKAAMAQDYAPWDNDYRAMVRDVCDGVRDVAGGVPGTHTALTLSGCGHLGVEAAIRSLLPPGGRLLVPATGAYAGRLRRLAQEAGRVPVTLEVPARERLDVDQVTDALRRDPSITHLALVYSETGSGICHDVPALARAAGELVRRVIVDAVSAFGALPLDLSELPAVDAVVLTSNKCLEGLPGATFAVCRADSLVAGRGNAGSWTMDLADIHEHSLHPNAGTRFTPPAQTLAALAVALDLHRREGRVARLARYTRNMQTLYSGVRELGLQPYLPPELQGPIIVNVLPPASPAWDLQAFVDAVKRHGFIISNFCNTLEPTFRVGCIGAITPDDMARAVKAIGSAMHEIGALAQAA